MKKLFFLFAFLLCFILPETAVAQVSSPNYFKLIGNVIKPLIQSWGLDFSSSTVTSTRICFTGDICRTTWPTGAATTTPGGLDTFVQVNASGTFAGYPGFTFTSSTGLLSVNGTVSSTALLVNGNATTTNLVTTGLFYTNASGTAITSTRAFFTNTTSTALVITATSTFQGALFQTGLADCSLESQKLVYNLTTGKLTCNSNGGGGIATTRTITQIGHSFTTGTVVRLSSSGQYQTAQADTVVNAEVIGMVSSVTNSSTFVLTTHGYITGLTGFATSTVYFLSTSVAGGVTSTEPTSTGFVSKPVFSADSPTSGYFINYRGLVNNTVSVVPVLTAFTATSTVTLTGTTTETTFIGQGVGSLNMSASYCTPGKQYILKLEGLYSTPAVSVGNIIFRIKLGSVTMATGTANTLASNATNLGFSTEYSLICRTTGPSGTVVGIGQIVYSVGDNLAPLWLGLNRATTTPTTINLTQDNAINVTAQWSTSTAGNSISSMSVSLEELN